jgi:hypothetical protein
MLCPNANYNVDPETLNDYPECEIGHCLTNGRSEGQLYSCDECQDNPKKKELKSLVRPHAVYRYSDAQGIHKVRTLSFTKGKSKYALSLGNVKLSGTVLIFNLPSGETCPGAGICKEYCYAKKMKQGFKGPEISRKRNWINSKKDSFISDIKEIITAVLNRFPFVVAIRPHEAGDFYNVEYAKKWRDIAKWMKENFPQLKFYFYTKSVFVKNIDWPDNVCPWYSLGGKWDDLIPNFGNKAYVVPKGTDPNAVLGTGVFYCTGGHKIPNHESWYVCGRDCDWCINNVKNNDLAVGFPIH